MRDSAAGPFDDSAGAWCQQAPLPKEGPTPNRKSFRESWSVSLLRFSSDAAPVVLVSHLQVRELNSTSRTNSQPHQQFAPRLTIRRHGRPHRLLGQGRDGSHCSRRHRLGVEVRSIADVTPREDSRTAETGSCELSHTPLTTTSLTNQHIAGRP